MHTSLTHHLPARRRAQIVAAGLSALAMSGAGAGGAQASAAHTQPATLGHQTAAASQILDVRSTMRKRGHSGSSLAKVTTITQYTDPSSNVTYSQLDQFPSVGASPDYVAWEADTPQSNHKRSVEQVDVDAINKQYSDKTATVSDAAPPEFGVESSADQVKQAIAKGKATRAGTTTYGGRRVLKLTVSAQSENERDVVLYVNPTNDAPVAETKTYTSGGDTFDYTAKFVGATSSAVSSLETKPSQPAGYTTSGS